VGPKGWQFRPEAPRGFVSKEERIIQTDGNHGAKDTLQDKALRGVKVLEYCSALSGPYCAKLMADLGAEVIKIERPGRGDIARHMAPFAGDTTHPEKSCLFLYLNTNKFGITLDPETPRGREIFLQLARKADVLIQDRPLGELERQGLGYEALREIQPGLILASFSPFGRSGPFKDYKAYPLNVAHASGQGYLLPLLSPHKKRPPVRAGGHATEYDSGLVMTVAVLAALFWKGVSGQGQLIELSKQEALISMQRVESVTYANDQVVMTRTGRENPMPGGVLPCKDGHIVVITPQEHQWNALMELLGNPPWSKEPWCTDRFSRAQKAELVNRLITEWTMQHTKEEIFRRGQALSCPVSPCHSTEDLVKSEQLKAREFFRDVAHPVVGTLKFPTTPYRFSQSPWTVERPAPLLGEANEEVYCGRLGFSKEALETLRKDGVI
jgi:crotonobetainyl-CoA:carnitine CoA-transferase CaiB-like acyl-CoA transferase